MLGLEPDRKSGTPAPPGAEGIHCCTRCGTLCRRRFGRAWEELDTEEEPEPEYVDPLILSRRPRAARPRHTIRQIMIVIGLLALNFALFAKGTRGNLGRPPVLVAAYLAALNILIFTYIRGVLNLPRVAPGDQARKIVRLMYVFLLTLILLAPAVSAAFD